MNAQMWPGAPQVVDRRGNLTRKPVMYSLGSARVPHLGSWVVGSTTTLSSCHHERHWLGGELPARHHGFDQITGLFSQRMFMRALSGARPGL